jgi:hypothetical protein
MLEFGYFGGFKGIITSWITPTFDAGILFWWGEPGDLLPGIEIKYRGSWLADSYVHAVGLGMIIYTWKEK